jgi:hypothetical protein
MAATKYHKGFTRLDSAVVTMDADTDACTGSEHTPLWVACFQSCSSWEKSDSVIAELLLKHGADIRVVNEDNEDLFIQAWRD